MRTTMRAGALTVVALMMMLAMHSTAASAQAAAQGCPPGQPSGRPPGQPPGNPPVQTGRPNYPPGRCQLALSQSAGQRGDTFTATGSGFVPGERVALSVAGISTGSATAGADGTFAATITVPSGAPVGPTEVLAAGQSQELAAGFDVLASGAVGAAPGEASLPRTGSDALPLTVGGVALVAVGAFAVVAARRQKGVLSS